MKLPYRTDIQVRFNDTDAFGHLNNTAYALYAEQARVDLFHELRDDSEELGLILARIALDFRKQVRYGEDVYVLTTIPKVGNTSVHLKQDIYADGVVAAEVDSVVVLFDYATQRPRAVPDSLRAQLTAQD